MRFVQFVELFVLPLHPVVGLLGVLPMLRRDPLALRLLLRDRLLARGIFTRPALYPLLCVVIGVRLVSRCLILVVRRVALGKDLARYSVSTFWSALRRPRLRDSGLRIFLFFRIQGRGRGRIGPAASAALEDASTYSWPFLLLPSFQFAHELDVVASGLLRSSNMLLFKHPVSHPLAIRSRPTSIRAVPTSLGYVAHHFVRARKNLLLERLSAWLVTESSYCGFAHVLPSTTSELAEASTGLLPPLWLLRLLTKRMEPTERDGLRLR